VRFEQIRAVVEVGRQLPQISALGKLAILHADTEMADAAIRLAGDMTVAARRIGVSNEERNHFEYIAVALCQQLEEELSGSTIALQQSMAIEAFLDREDESAGSPDSERILGHSATAMIVAISEEFQTGLGASLHSPLRQWFESAQFIEQLLYPKEIVELAFPDNLLLAVWAPEITSADESINSNCSKSWIGGALGRFIPPQHVNLRSSPASRIWRMLTIQRGRELGIKGLESLEKDGDFISRESAVERVFRAVLATADERFAASDPTDKTPDWESTEERNSSAAASQKCEQTVGRSTSEAPSTAREAPCFAYVFGVTIDENKQELSRRGQKNIAKFPRKGNCIEWQLAKWLISAKQKGMTVGELQDEWPEFGGKKSPSPRTIANMITAVNRLFELIGLEAIREMHNGPWIITSITSPSRTPD